MGFIAPTTDRSKLEGFKAPETDRATPTPEAPGILSRAGDAVANVAKTGLDTLAAPFELTGEALRLAQEGKPLSDFRAPAIVQRLRGNSLTAANPPADPVSQINKGIRAGAGFVQGAIQGGTLDAAKKQGSIDYNADRGGMGALEDIVGSVALGHGAPAVANAPLDAVDAAMTPVKQFIKAPFYGNMNALSGEALKVKALAASKGVDLPAADLIGSKGLAFFQKIFENAPLTADMMQEKATRTLVQMTNMRNKLLENSNATDAEANIEVLGNRIQAAADDFVRGRLKGTVAQNVALKDALLKKIGSLSTYEELGQAGHEAINKASADYAKTASAAYDAVKTQIPEGMKFEPANLRATADKLLAKEMLLPEAQRDKQLLSTLQELAPAKTPMDPNLESMLQGLSPQAREAAIAQGAGAGATPTPKEPMTWEQLQGNRSAFKDQVRQNDVGTKTGMQMTGNRVAGAYKQLASAVSGDLQGFATAAGTDAKTALDTADQFYASGKKTFNAPYIQRLAKSNPSAFIDTMFSPGNARMIDDVKAALPPQAFEDLRGGFTNKLLGVGKSEEGFDPEKLRSALDKYGPEVLGKIYGEKTKSLYDLADAGAELDKSAATNEFFRNLVKNPDATKVLKYIVKPGNTSNYSLVKDNMGAQAVENVRQALVGDLLSNNQHGLFSPTKFHSTFTKYGEATLKAWLPPDVYKDMADSAKISMYSTTAERMAGNPSQTSRNLMMLHEGKAILKNPVTGMITQLPTVVLGKLFMNPKTRDWLTSGFKVDASSQEGVHLYQLISTYLAKPQNLLNSTNPAYADTVIKQPETPQTPQDQAKEHYRAGVDAFLNKDMKTTRANWQLALKADPTNLEARRGLERLDQKEGKTKSIPVSSQNAQAAQETYKSGLQAFLSKDYGAAQMAWDKASALDPNNIEAKRGAERLRQKGAMQPTYAGR